MDTKTSYFTHDANALDDPKCMLLVEQLGMEGYGIFWALVEKLRQQADCRLPLALISRWYAQINALKLAPYVKYVQAGVKEGTPVVRLILYRPGTKENGAQLLLPDEAERWAEAVLAVRKLYGALENMPPDIFIDCTYKDKILLRNTGAGEKEEKKAEGAKK